MKSHVTPSVQGNESRQRASDTLSCVFETDGGTSQYAQQHPARRTMRQRTRAHFDGKSGAGAAPGTTGAIRN